MTNIIDKIKRVTPHIRKRINMAIWIFFGVVLFGVIVVFAAIAKGVIGYMPPIEQLENPIDRYASQILDDSGEMIGSYSFTRNNRIYVDYKDLSPDLVNALIATEDKRFADHSGIDVVGLMRAVVKRGILMQKSGGGGSTITQQLAKQLYSPNAESVLERLFQKPIEWVIAIRLEKYFTKEEIIGMYLNKFDFLHNAVGIKTAAQVYFATSPKELKIEEAATLVGMCKNPSYYNPRKYEERARLRRNTVLSQMQKNGSITKQVCDSLSKLPLEVKFTRVDHKDGIATYFREYLRTVMIAPKPERKNYPSWQLERYGKFEEDSIAWETNPLFGWCNKNRKPNGDPYNIYTDGLKIYTTINSKMQRFAEDVVRDHVGGTLQPSFFKEKARDKKYAPFSFPYSMSEADKTKTINGILQRAISQSYRYKVMKDAGAGDKEIEAVFKTKTEMSVFTWDRGMIDTVMTPRDSILYYKTFLRTGFMAMDSHTGHVKAYVGGINYANFQYDMVTTGRRQVGSTMKPFLYSLAMSEGFTPCDKMLHVQQYLQTEEGKAPWAPRNSTSKNIGEEVTLRWGLQNSSNWVTAYLMKRLSPHALVRLLRSYGFKGRIDPVVSMCLGTPDISVAEMVSGYSVFAKNGIRIEPMYVTRIDDVNGNTIAEFTAQVSEVLSEDAAFKTLSMLRAVVDGGTASRIRYKYGINAEMGGKTGTTQNNSDGWFMGFTPKLVVGCWVGGEDRSIHFNQMSEGQGANVALPIFANFMKKVYAEGALGYSANDKFIIPPQFSDPCASGGAKSVDEEAMNRVNAQRIDEMFD